MLYKDSYSDVETKAAIEALVGKPFSILKRMRLGLGGSQRFIIQPDQSKLHSQLQKTNATAFCNIGILPKGIKIWFTIKLDQYVLAIPFTQLEVNVKSQHLTIYAKPFKLHLVPANNTLLKLGFLEKMNKHQAAYLSTIKKP